MIYVLSIRLAGDLCRIRQVRFSAPFHSLECSNIKLRTRAVAIVAESCIAYKFESQFLRIIVQYALIECADAVNKFLHKHFKLCGSLFVFFLCP